MYALVHLHGRKGENKRQQYTRLLSSKIFLNANLKPSRFNKTF